MSEDKITQEEMVALFGSTMPMDAVDLLCNAADNMTLGQARSQLREIAKANNGALKPCPGCGGAAKLVFCDGDLYIKCENFHTCGIRLDRRYAGQAIDHTSSRVLIGHWNDLVRRDALVEPASTIQSKEDS